MKAEDILKGIFVCAVCLFIVFYLVIQMMIGNTSDVAYEYATHQTFEKALEKNAYIVRSEEILYSEKSGVLSYDVSESEKIGSGQLIATVYTNTQGIDVQREIDALENKLSILSRSSVDTGYLTSDVSKIDNKIKQSLFSVGTAVQNEDLSLISKYKDDLLIHMNKRELVTSGSGDYSEKIAELQAKKDQLKVSLQNPIDTVYSDKTGYFSTLLDGYETIFKPEVIEDLTITKFDELVKADQIRYPDSAIGKLITNFDWHLLCEISASEAEAMTVGNKYPVSFLSSSGQQIKAILEKKINQTDSERAILVFRMEDVPSGFDYTRCQAIKIVLESKIGVAFPSSALRMVDNKPGVYVVAGNVVKFKRVEIIDSSDSNFLSKIPDENTKNPEEYLTKFDRVITEGKNLNVGKILN